MKLKESKRYIKNYIFLICITSILVGITGCSPKKVVYFQDAVNEAVLIAEPQPIKIAPNDRLTIVIKTMDPELSSLFNLQMVSETMGNGYSTAISKFTVTPSGEIDFPVLGLIKVSGMNRSELAAFIKGELMGRSLAKDPVVTVEFVNMGVSVLGEVMKPGRYEIERDRLSIIEAISLAGDLTITGERDNIAVLRETDNGLQTYRVDLTNLKELVESPAYYVQQGDVIYVEPNDMRQRQTTTNGNNVLSTGFWISIASLATSIVTTIAVFIR